MITNYLTFHASSPSGERDQVTSTFTTAQTARPSGTAMASRATAPEQSCRQAAVLAGADASEVGAGS